MKPWSTKYWVKPMKKGGSNANMGVVAINIHMHAISSYYQYCMQRKEKRKKNAHILVPA